MLSFLEKPHFYKFFILSIFILFGVISFLLFKNGYFEVSKILLILEKNTLLAPMIFVLIYMLMAMSFIPTLPLNLAAGFLWGTFLGTILTLFGAGLGALISFMISRLLFKEKIGHLFKGKIWSYINKELANKEWQVVAFTRLNPIFPFGPTSWFFGITKIKARNYLWPTIICIIPAATAFSAIGSSLESFVLSGNEKALYKNIMIASAFITILICIRIGFKLYSKSFIQTK